MELRKIEIKDIELLFNWANDFSVRKNAINSNAIKWEDHVAWFTNKLDSDINFIYILEDNKTPIGQIRFDKTDNGYLIDYSIDSLFRKKGYGTKIVALGCKALRKELEQSITILAQVKNINIGSSKIFVSLNFLQEETISKEVSYSFKKVM
jgi:RimJ/RimL family protein N-acetyltransferase